MKYDFVIVGAGSAGAILATRLSENPKVSVLLLEAGSDYPDLEQIPPLVKYVSSAGTEELLRGPHAWQFVARATDQAPPMPVPRGKLTGGSSAINWAAFVRGMPSDYDSWAAAGLDRWSFKEVLPYFRKIEADPDFSGDFHGKNGPVKLHRFHKEDWGPIQHAFHNACLAEGFPYCPDHNSPDSSGVGSVPRNVDGEVRYSTALAYLSQARHRLNLTIRANCLVHKVLFRKKRAVGLMVESGGEIFTVSGKEIILCAGAIGSPHILMLSGIGPAAQLKKAGIPIVQDLPGVGQNLRDHPKVSVVWRVKDEYKIDQATPTFSLCLRFTTPHSKLKNDMWISMSTSYNKPVVDKSFQPDTSVIQMMIGLALEESSGQLKLASSSPYIHPILDYNYLTASADRERFRDAVRLSVRLSQHKDLKKITGELINPTEHELASDDALDQWMLREVTTYSHVCGTCKMGPESDNMAVVDQFGRVRSIEGLRVVDASIMPDCVRAFINATVMMAGERMADLIKDQNKPS